MIRITVPILPKRQCRVLELTSQERSNAENRIEASLLRYQLVIETMLYIQRIREDNSLPVFDSLLVVEISHHFDEILRVARILANA